MTDGQQIVFEARGVHHWFGSNKVLYDVNLKIAQGQIVALVGPSGCGKSTLLRALLGTHPPWSGEVLMDGHAYRRPNRDRGIVYQRYSLFPFLTARENVAFGLMLDQTAIWQRAMLWKWLPLKEKHLDAAEALLERLQLKAAANRYPEEMSGGMRQRVAIAQALIMKPRLLLLDEPFGALDEATREDLQEMLLHLYQENLAAQRAGLPPPHTILIVTHELTEAIYVSDRVVGLSQYWDWPSEGMKEAPGATIVYDRVAPVYHPDDDVEHAQFVAQREDLRNVVFQPEPPRKRDEFVRFWDECAAGLGAGVMGAIQP